MTTTPPTERPQIFTNTAGAATIVRTDMRADPVVSGVINRRGRGKTLLATHFCDEADQAGRPVFHNGPLHFGTRMHADQLVQLSAELQDAVVLIDEAPIWMPAKGAMTFANRMIAVFLQQVRKRNCDIVWTAQFDHLVDGALRDQTDIMWRVDTPTDRFWKGRILSWQAIDYNWQWSPLPRFRKHDSRLRRWGQLIHADELWHRYDTDYVVDPYALLGLTREAMLEKMGNETGSANMEQFAEIIDELRAGGMEWAAPGRLTTQLKRDYGIDLTAKKTGEMLRDLGYPKTRGSDGMWYHLEPPTDDDGNPIV